MPDAEPHQIQNITMPGDIETKFLVMSDTYGQQPLTRPLTEHIDVLIHCGDLTDGSDMKEFENTFQYLKDIPADLKLVIAGNHDFTLDISQKMAKNALQSLQSELRRQRVGDTGEIKKTVLEKAKAANVILLDEGSYKFKLQNGALLRVYASQFTPSSRSIWGFHYDPDYGRNFEIPPDVDVVITHGPPKDILDVSNSGKSISCPDLFQAVARAQPRLHCFGHIHEGWGGKRVTWKKRPASDEKASYSTHIDDEKSTVLCDIDQLEDMRIQGSDLQYLAADCCVSGKEQQTLFVNAALQYQTKIEQIPWLVTIPLPHADVGCGD